MLSDKVRMSLYKKAISETIKKGDVVADIGTGSGILGFFSLQAGASKVYAIEQNEIIEESKKIAEVNGWSDRILFIKERSDRIELPEKVDAITSELIGYFGLEEKPDKYLIDARKRFLKPSGTLIPYSLRLFLSGIEAQSKWDQYISLWSSDFYGTDYSKVKEFAVSQRYVTDCSSSEGVKLMSQPSLLLAINFYQDEEIPLVFKGDLTIKQNGTLHGLLGYFEVELSQNVMLSSSPELPVTHWKQTFFPIPGPLAVQEEDVVQYTIKAIPLGNNVYWEWRGNIQRNDILIGSFNQSNFNINKEELFIRNKNSRPNLSEKAKIHHTVLGLCNGQRTIEEISKKIVTAYPDKYVTVKDAMQDVTSILRGKLLQGAPAHASNNGRRGKE